MNEKARIKGFRRWSGGFRRLAVGTLRSSRVGNAYQRPAKASTPPAKASSPALVLLFSTCHCSRFHKLLQRLDFSNKLASLLSP